MAVMPHRKTDKYAKTGEDMLDILAHDIMRYEMLTDNKEIQAFAFVLQGETVEKFSLVEIVVGNEIENSSEIEKLSEVGAQEDDKENHIAKTARFQNFSLDDTDSFLLNSVNKNTEYKTRSDLKTFYDWALENNEMRKLEDVTFQEMDNLLA